MRSNCGRCSTSCRSPMRLPVRRMMDLVAEMVPVERGLVPELALGRSVHPKESVLRSDCLRSLVDKTKRVASTKRRTHAESPRFKTSLPLHAVRTAMTPLARSIRSSPVCDCACRMVRGSTSDRGRSSIAAPVAR